MADFIQNPVGLPISKSTFPIMNFKCISQTTALGSGYASGSFTNFLTLDLELGVWCLTGLVTASNSGPLTSYEVAISKNSGNVTSDHLLGQNSAFGSLGSNLSAGTCCIPNLMMTNESPQTYYLKIKVTGKSANIFCGRLSAMQIG